MRSLWILILLFGLKTALGQISDSTEKDSLVKYISKSSKEVMDAIVVNGDTVPLLVLDDVLLLDKPTFSSRQARRRYHILKRKVIKVYPYAVLAGNKLDSLNLLLEGIKGRRKKKRFTKKFQKFLEEEFEAELRKLTHSEGQILSKLIYRETGVTTYELISKYRSGWNAFWWNIAANYYDISLKTPYAPEVDEEDRLIESILRSAFLSGQLEERVPITEL